ncbi:MAG: phosphoribosyltransferase [Prochloraceae cyanobacterium]
MSRQLENRKQAGKLLSSKLSAYANLPDTIILALPRGGVPVAFEIAKALNLPLDLCLVRKLGLPSHPELAMGAIASNGVIVLNSYIIQSYQVTKAEISAVVDRETEELARRDRLYRQNKPLPNVENKTIILVDDGIATGSTIRAALSLLRKQHPQNIIIAIPVADCSICFELRQEVDEVICLYETKDLYSISSWYQDFSQTEDREVRELLAMLDRDRLIK